jgi:hypothetical protein
MKDYFDADGISYLKLYSESEAVQNENATLLDYLSTKYTLYRIAITDIFDERIALELSYQYLLINPNKIISIGMWSFFDLERIEKTQELPYKEGWSVNGYRKGEINELLSKMI